MSSDPNETERNPPILHAPASDWADEETSTRLTDSAIAAQAAQTKASPRALLTIISGPNAGRAFSLRNGDTLIGRGRESHVRIDDGGASRVHARIVVAEGGRHTIEDLGSTNGTFVAGRRIEGVTELSSGDRINIGPNVGVSFSILDAQAEMMVHELYESAVRDALTKAHNRRYLVERLTSEIAYAKRHVTRLALILFDIDHFKRVNDAYGHLAGDDALREISALVSRLIRAEDVFARFGGEEFVVLARGIEHANAGLFSERLRSSVERLDIRSEGAVIHVTISVGYASLDELAEPERSAEGLIRLADERLYHAKSGGRNRVRGGE